MSYTVQEWLNLAFRWTHIFSAIMWVGATYYFTWLDRRFHSTDPDQVWMVHSGGFYVVNKTGKPSPDHTLHWFKWEAFMTWLSGTLLLILVYYLGGAMMDGEPGKPSFPVTVAIGVGTILIGWIVYDVLWISPLAKIEPVAIAISFALLTGLAWWLPRVMSSRAAILHIGALLGTIMFANVWQRIIPSQRRMVAAVREGREPDQKLADRAKFRSKHNTYIVIPVVMMMISNHYPGAILGNHWLAVPVLTLAGWVIAHFVRKH